MSRTPPLPAWIESLLAGDWQSALPAMGGHPPAPEFRPLAEILAAACHAAGREDAARRILGSQAPAQGDLA